jgi:hypothetical protein
LQSYAYADLDPILRADPSGLTTLVEMAVVTAITTFLIRTSLGLWKGEGWGALWKGALFGLFSGLMVLLGGYLLSFAWPTLTTAEITLGARFMVALLGGLITAIQYAVACKYLGTAPFHWWAFFLIWLAATVLYYFVGLQIQISLEGAPILGSAVVDQVLRIAIRIFPAALINLLSTVIMDATDDPEEIKGVQAIKNRIEETRAAERAKN